MILTIITLSKKQKNHNTKEYIKYDSLYRKFKIKQNSNILFMITYINLQRKTQITAIKVKIMFTS